MARQDIVSYQFQKGISGNPNGRPRKFITLAKQLGYKHSEITETMLTLAACTLVELREIYLDPEATILEKIVASALKRSVETGSLHNLEIILSRAVGRPRERAEIKQEVDMKAFTVTMVKVDRPFASAEAEVCLD